MTNAAMVALIAWLDASDKNAQQNDTEWSEGFKKVMSAQDALKRYFSSNEISGFIINKDELRKIISEHRVQQ